MTFQHKENTGSLFKNDKRETDSHPNAKGSALIDGVDYWISAWTNDGNQGKYQSLKFSKKEENKTSRRDYSEASKPEAPQDEYDSSVPF